MLRRRNTWNDEWLCLWLITFRATVTAHFFMTWRQTLIGWIISRKALFICNDMQVNNTLIDNFLRVFSCCTFFPFEKYQRNSANFRHVWGYFLRFLAKKFREKNLPENKLGRVTLRIYFFFLEWVVVQSSNSMIALNYFQL